MCDHGFALVTRCPVCDNLPTSEAGEPRSYVVGLPVVLTVHPDGRVSVWVDTSEAAAAISEDYPDAESDADAVATWHTARREGGV